MKSSWKKILFGSDDPDMTKPENIEKYNQSKEAGEKFAKKLRLDKLVAKIQGFAERHSKLFLGIVFAFVIFLLSLNLIRISRAINNRKSNPTPSAVQQQRDAFDKQQSSTNNTYELNGNDN